MIDDVLKTELETYEAKKNELLGQARGQWVLIKGTEVIGIFHCQKDAIRQGYERLGPVAFLTKEIVEFDRPWRMSHGWM